jgi:glycosyltransferase involved in cell wall biosynthesis
MLAIIIPFYKIKFFDFTLKSLVEQTDKRFTVYIGNDCSIDDPTEIIKNYEGRITIKYHLFDVNLGAKSLAKQWQRCVDLIDDEQWIMMLCDDDLLDENCISEFYKNLEEINNNDIDVVRFSTDVIDEFGTKFNKNVYHPKFEKSTDFLVRRLKGGTRNSLSENIFKRDKVLQNKFKNFPLAWHSDDLALLEFSNFGTLFTINEAKVYFRLSDLNITNKADNVAEKNDASFQFFYYLLCKKSSKFTLEQYNVIRNKLEKRVLENKMKVKYWMLILFLYFRDLKFKEMVTLFLKVPKSIKK